MTNLTFALDLSPKNYGKVTSYPTRAAAESDGNGRVLVNSEDDIINAVMFTGSEMVSFFKKIGGQFKGQHERFSTRNDGATRLFALLPGVAIEAETTEGNMTEAGTEAPKKAKKEKKVKVESTSAGSGRKSAYAGKTIIAKTEENPRREGSHGHKAFAIILSHKHGITYENYMAAGGGLNHLNWDIEHGYAEAVETNH